MADVTEQTPLAATEPRPKSRKGLVAAVAAVSLTLAGFAAALQARSELVVCGVFLKRRLERKVEVSGVVI